MKKLILVLALLFVPVFASASIDTNLYYGLRNNQEVTELQEFLIEKGFLTHQATGSFLSLTLKAVKDYQISEGINPTGYVGVLTRTAINNELAAGLSESNQQSVAETGTTPPASEPQKTTNDVVSQLQAQIALLQQQLNAMNTQSQANAQANQQLQQKVEAQTQVIQKVQEDTSKVVQNTTPPPAPVPPAKVRGCTDKSMKNYNVKAEEDDGSCVAWILGCMDKLADNYNVSAEKSGACNYSPYLKFVVESQGGGRSSNAELLRLTIIGNYFHGSEPININSQNPVSLKLTKEGSIDNLPDTIKIYSQGTYLYSTDCQDLQCTLILPDTQLGGSSNTSINYEFKADTSSTTFPEIGPRGKIRVEVLYGGKYEKRPDNDGIPYGYIY